MIYGVVAVVFVFAAPRYVFLDKSDRDLREVYAVLPVCSLVLGVQKRPEYIHAAHSVLVTAPSDAVAVVFRFQTLDAEVYEIHALLLFLRSHGHVVDGSFDDCRGNFIGMFLGECFKLGIYFFQSRIHFCVYTTSIIWRFQVYWMSMG